MKVARPVGILCAAIVAALGATVALAVSTGATTSGVTGSGATSITGTGTGTGATSTSITHNGATGAGISGSQAGTTVITAVAAEDQYGSVIAQVGGKYVKVTSLLSNPNTDPHAFEASPQVARTVKDARLIVQNGLGYDSFMDSIESASPMPGRRVITVQQLLRLPSSTSNPHLWYSPPTMPAVAGAVATDLAVIDPAHAAYYRANASTFIRSLSGWDSTLAALKSDYPGAAVATTEPVADYLLAAAGVVNATPWTFQADIMNGVDPSPQDVATERDLLADRKVKALVYNVQVTDQLTQSLIALARASGIPVVGVYETMPQSGFDYQSWMLAEADALKNAISSATSTEHL
jgi:zinc/manganese transport system substrate-binding protein